MQTDRDAEIVGWIGRVGAAGADHAMRRFRLGQSVAYERLAALVSDGLLEHRMLLYRRPGLYAATAEGLRWRLGVHRVGPGGFEHARQVATAAVALHQGAPECEVLSERELRAHENDTGELLASVRLGRLPGGREALHRPDLALIHARTGGGGGRGGAVRQGPAAARDDLHRLRARTASASRLLPRHT